MGCGIFAPQSGPVSLTPTATAAATPFPTASPQPPTPTPPGGPAAITVSQPQAGAEVRSPVRVQGTAMVFEANVQIVVRNAQGQEVGQGFTTATAGAPERGDYNASIPFTLSGGRQNGTVEVFSHSPRDGAVISLVRVPVVLLPN